MRKKQKSGVIKVSLVWLSLFFSAGFSPMSQNNPMNVTMADIIRKQVDEICSLKVNVMDLKTEISRLKNESVEDKQVLEAINSLTEGAIHSDWANPDNVRRIKRTCQKYEYIIKDVKHEYANWKYMFSICVTDTGCNPNHINTNKNGTSDWGLGDLNDCILKYVEKDLPDNLKYRSWLNIEKSIAGRYVWINQRIKSKMAWAYLSDRGWRLYAKINNYEKTTVYAK